MQTAFSFDKATMVKIGKGILIAVGGAAVTYFAQYVSNTNFGVYTPLVVAGSAIIINAIKEYIAGVDLSQE